MHTNFFKKVLSLPINTPNYVVRIETGGVRLSLAVLKTVLGWLQKIVNMLEERYHRLRCRRIFEMAIRKIQTNQNFKLALQVKGLTGGLELMRDENGLDINFIVNNKVKILKEYELFLRGTDHKKTAKIVETSDLSDFDSRGRGSVFFEVETSVFGS